MHGSYIYCVYHEILHRLSESVDHGRNTTMDMPVRSNLSYVKAPGSHMSNSTTKARGACPSQVVTVNQLEGRAGPDYCSIGPDYETIDSRSGQLQKKKSGASCTTL